MTSRFMAASFRRGLTQQRPTAALNTAVRYASGGGGYNQPTGKIFGEDAPEPGKKRAKEDWEDLWFYGMFGGMAFAAVIILYKPDTTIQTWAMGEAKKRLEGGEGVWKYEPSPNSGHPKGI